MNRLSIQERAQILGLMVEGNSLRAASRLADVSINTVTKLLVDMGAACEEYQDRTIRGLKCKRIQCDEIWALVYAKAKNLPEQYRGAFGCGDVWTWTAICAQRVVKAANELLQDMTVYQFARFTQVLEAVYKHGKKEGARQVFEEIDGLKGGIPHALPGRPAAVDLQTETLPNSEKAGPWT